MMRHVLTFAVFVSLLAPVLPAQAQGPAPEAPEAPEPPGTMSEGLGLMEEGARRLLGGLLAEIGPGLDGAGEGLGQELSLGLGEGMAQLRALAGMLGDLSAFELPERLENGDILIRRKPAPPAGPDMTDPEIGPDTGPEFGPGGEIEL